jgi:hypothetical protein
MKVFVSDLIHIVSDLIHKSTSDILIYRYESDRRSIKALSNTSGIEESPDQKSPGGRFKAALPECTTSTRWFRDAIPGDKEA